MHTVNTIQYCTYGTVVLVLFILYQRLISTVLYYIQDALYAYSGVFVRFILSMVNCSYESSLVWTYAMILVST